MEHGICKLCLKDADLLESHYLWQTHIFNEYGPISQEP